MRNLSKGQSTLEYIIIFTVIVAAVLVAANMFIRPKVTSMLNHTANEAESAVKHIDFGANQTHTE